MEISTLNSHGLDLDISSNTLVLLVMYLCVSSCLLFLNFNLPKQKIKRNITTVKFKKKLSI
ncbi:Uncharacterised protein [Mycobacterium tuberculosis]|nr:Uncharacterised protein [Mycobacterium tuberculosis]